MSIPVGDGFHPGFPAYGSHPRADGLRGKPLSCLTGEEQARLAFRTLVQDAKGFLVQDEATAFAPIRTFIFLQGQSVPRHCQNHFGGQGCNLPPGRAQRAVGSLPSSGKQDRKPRSANGIDEVKGDNLCTPCQWYSAIVEYTTIFDNLCTTRIYRPL